MHLVYFLYERKQKMIPIAHNAIQEAIVIDQPRDSEITAMPYMDMAAPM